jgi:hypothetical protein
MFDGCLWLRIVARQLSGLLLNDPPRNTRDLTIGHPFKRLVDQVSLGVESRSLITPSLV